MVRVCESHTIFLCVRRPCICPTRYLLLNHYTKFNQTCYITSLNVKDVREKHYFSVRPLSVHLSVMPSPNHWAAFNQTCYITSPHGKGVRPSISPSCYLLLNHWAKFNQTCYMTSHHGKESKSVRPSYC